MRKLAVVPLFVLLVATAAGCGVGRQIRHGINCYKTAHYAGAMEKWEELGNCDCQMNHKATVRYLVYRGLTHYHLGEIRWAQHYLRKGSQAYLHGSPRWLPRGAVLEMNAILARTPGPAAAPRVVNIE